MNSLESNYSQNNYGQLDFNQNTTGTTELINYNQQGMDMFSNGVNPLTVSDRGITSFKKDNTVFEEIYPQTEKKI